MISLIEHIEYLTIHHDFVVVPGWGAMIAQYTASTIDEATGVWVAPARSFSFNAQVNHNDGLLAQSLVRREGITYDDAVALIARCVAEYRARLLSGEQVSFGRLGSFVMGIDDRIVYRPARGRVSHLDSYFGLGDVSLAPLTAAAKPVGRVVRRDVFAPWVRRAGQVAASIAVIVMLLFALTTPTPVVDQQMNFASLDLPTVTAPKQAAHTDIWSDANIDLAIAKPEQGRYYLVVATMSSQEQADVFIATNPEIASRARTMMRGNTCRVYIARSDSQAELYRQIAQLPARYRQCWIGE